MIPLGFVELVGDANISEHPKKWGFGKGCHRDAVRLSHSFTLFRWGHE